MVCEPLNFGLNYCRITNKKMAPMKGPFLFLIIVPVTPVIAVVMMMMMVVLISPITVTITGDNKDPRSIFPIIAVMVMMVVVVMVLYKKLGHTNFRGASSFIDSLQLFPSIRYRF